MKRILYLVIFLCICPIVTDAAEWEKYNTGAYIDTTSIKQANDGSYNFRYRIINGQKILEDEEIKQYSNQAAYTILNANIDCQRGTMYRKGMAIYNIDNQYIYGREYKSTDINNKHYIDPYSEEKVLSDYVCTYFMNRILKTKIKKESTITNEEVDLTGYMAELERSVKSNWVASEIKENEKTVVLFSVNRNGDIIGDIKVIKSSGNEENDAKAIQAVKASEPFYPLPKQYNGNKIDVEYTFDYKMIEKKEKKK